MVTELVFFWWVSGIICFLYLIISTYRWHKNFQTILHWNSGEGIIWAHLEGAAGSHCLCACSLLRAVMVCSRSDGPYHVTLACKMLFPAGMTQLMTEVMMVLGEEPVIHLLMWSKLFYVIIHRWSLPSLQDFLTLCDNVRNDNICKHMF